MDKIKYTSFDTRQLLEKRVKEYFAKAKEVKFKTPIPFILHKRKYSCTDIVYEEDHPTSFCRCTIWHKHNGKSLEYYTYAESFTRQQLLRLIKAINNNE